VEYVIEFAGVVNATPAVVDELVAVGAFQTGVVAPVITTPPGV